MKCLTMDYTNKTIVNEIISVMTDEYRLVIHKEIHVASCLSALIDESKDLVKREEIAFSVRYFFNDNITECFIQLVMLTVFDAKSIMTVTKTQIEIVQQLSNLAPVISLGADGANVMSGELVGVAQLLKSHFEWLMYIHCTAHHLNLVVNTLINTSVVGSNVMSFINLFYIFKI